MLAVSETFAQARTIAPERLEVTKDGDIAQPFLYAFPGKKIQISYRSFHCRDQQDSILVCSLETKPFILPASAGVLRISLRRQLDNLVLQSYLNPELKEIILRFEAMPPGIYRSYLKVKFSESSDSTLSLSFAVDIDSSLALNSKIRNRFNQAFTQGETPYRKSNVNNNLSAPITEEEAILVSRKLQRKTKVIKGVYTHTAYHSGILSSELYYRNWFLGRYPLANLEDMRVRATVEANAIQQNVTNSIQNELSNFESVGSQMRRIFSESNKQELTGDIDVNFNAATGQDPYSVMDPTYTDIQGLFVTEVKKVPISIEGYYTTQDRNRQAKASYFRIRYDVEAAKEKLSKFIQGYRGKFEETVSKGAGLQSIYRQYSRQLETQARQLLSTAAAEYQIKPEILEEVLAQNKSTESLLQQLDLDTGMLMQQAIGRLQTSAQKDSAIREFRIKYEKAKQKIQLGKDALVKKQEQYKDLMLKIEKYNRLLDQYQDLVKLDSLANFRSIEKLKGKDGSYREMAKAAEGILPDGKAHTFLSGLTHLEGGIMSRYESAYTLAGQTMKGGAVGYDLGWVKASGSMGSVEYINRDGGVDKYVAYMGRLDSKEYGGQKTAVVYYGYSPTRQILKSANFLGKVDAAFPSFSKPVHILSLVHSGRIGNSFTFEGEAAASNRQSEETSIRAGLDNMAIKAMAEYRIPATNIGLSGNWEHMGKDFENQSLPIIRSGTERYMAGLETSLFRQFLNIKVSWNYLVQQSAIAESGNTRWGVEARTKSKRFPSLLFAYKPFSTFHTVHDTLALPQRPLLGEVWVARANYQLKRPGGVFHRFVMSWNYNRSSGGDTLSYKSTTFQGAYNYTARKRNIGINAGFMEIPIISPNQPLSGYAGGQSCFLNINISRNFRRASLQAGNELAFAGAIGLQKLSFLAGGSYRFQKTPLSLRMVARYSRYRLHAGDPYSNLVVVQVGIGWRFKYSLSNKEESL